MPHELDPLTGDPMPIPKKRAEVSNDKLSDSVNPNDDTAVLDLIRKKLVLALEKSDNAREIVAVAGELMDRIEGKPMQRQQSMVAIADANKPLPDNDRAALEHYFRIRGINND